jgi:hypothetical protein
MTSASTASRVASSPSPRARLKSSRESARPESIFSRLPHVSSSARRSLPRSWARVESFQTFGSSRALEISTRRAFFVS